MRAATFRSSRGSRGGGGAVGHF